MLSLAVLAASSSARASGTTEITPDYAAAYADHVVYTSPAELKRNTGTAESSAFTSGELEVSTTMDSKNGGSLPYVSDGYASASASIGADVSVPEGTKSIRFQASVYVDDSYAWTNAARALDVGGSAGADLSLGVDWENTPECSCTQSSGGYTLAASGGGPDTRHQMIQFGSSVSGEFPESLRVVVNLYASSLARTTKGSTEAGAHVHVLRITAEFSDQLPENPPY